MGSKLAALTTSIALLAAPHAQQAPVAPPKPVVPVAASSLAADPEQYRGQYVSLVGAVERILSPTTFSIDQNARNAAADTAGEVLIVAPTLIGAVELNAYVTVLGEVVRFDPEEIARKVKDYTVDLAPEVVEKYRGRPAVVATGVLNAALVDLARRPPPPLTPEEEAYDRLMKQIGPAFNALRRGIDESAVDVAKEQTAVLKQAFAETEAFWKAKGVADATLFSQESRRLADFIARAAAAGLWDDVKASAGTLGQMCQKCHATYREKLDDGTSRIRASTR